MTQETPYQQLQADTMKASDLDEVLAIEKVSFATPWTRSMYLDELANRSARSTVFRLNSRIVGYACWWEVLDEGHLMTFAVHPERRGQGFGKAILRYLEEVCFKDGIRRIILEVGRKNTVARTLYRKCGFAVIGFRKRYYQDTEDDALVMEKSLNQRNMNVSGSQGETG
ncbi:MAG: ribosomal protein S18-alanine N-acetyltransferase [Thermodesulfobacteriota bacterium]